MTIPKRPLICALLAAIMAICAFGSLPATHANAQVVSNAQAVSASASQSTLLGNTWSPGNAWSQTPVVNKAASFSPNLLDITSSTSGSATETVPFTIVYLPIKDWSEISAQRYPNLYRVVEGAAIGNLVSNDSGIYQQIIDNNNINLYDLGRLDNREADGEIAKLLPDNLEQGVFVLVCSPSFVRQESCPALTPVLVFGAGFSGYLTSSTTMRSGLIAATDILYFEKQLNNAEEDVVTTPTQAASKTIFDLTGSQSGQLLKDKLAFLQHNINICKGIAATIEPMNWLFLALFMLSAAFSLVLLFFEIDVQPRFLSILVPVCRGLLLVMLSFPIACFLMFIIPPPFYGFTDSAGGLVSLCLLWTVLLVSASLVIGSVSKWIYSLLFLFVITFAVLIINLLLGGPLTLTGYLNYAVNDGIRYFGLGNEASALLFGSWITFAGLVVNRFTSAKLVPAFKRWLFLLASTVIIVICVLPNVGASFGVLIWGVMGILITWWLLSGRPITLKFVLIVLALSLSLAVGVLFVDLNFNPYSHMAYLAPYIQSDPLGLLKALAENLFSYSLRTVTYSPALSVVFLIVVLWLIALAAIKPGTYREFWARNLGFRACYAAGLTTVLMMCLIEDSGIYMPSLYIVYLLGGFIWLVCDMHTWRARAAAKAGQPITLRALMRMAIARETYEALGKGAELAEKLELAGSTPTSNGDVSAAEACTEPRHSEPKPSRTDNHP